MEKLTELRTAEEQEKFEAEKQEILRDFFDDLKELHQDYIELTKKLDIMFPEDEHEIK